MKRNGTSFFSVCTYRSPRAIVALLLGLLFLLVFNPPAIADSDEGTLLHAVDNSTVVDNATPQDNATTPEIPMNTFDAVILDVLRTHPEILETVRNYRSVKAELDAVYSENLPSIGAEFSAGQQTTKGPATENLEEEMTASTSAVFLRQNLFSGFSTSNTIKEVKARVEAAAYQVLATANDITLKTIDAYLTVLQERELLQLATINVTTQTQILEQIKQKTESGFGRASDLLNSQSRLALARSNFITQQMDVQQALNDFHRQLGRFQEPYEFVPPTIELNIPPTLEEALDTAIKNNPAMRVADANLRARQFALKKANAPYLPTLDFELRAQHTSDTGGVSGDTNQVAAMLYLTYVFYDGGERGANKQRFFSNLHKEHERYAIERRNINEVIRSAWTTLDAEDKKREFLQEHVTLSEKTLEAFIEEYRLGRRDLNALLDMENEVNNARKALVESRFKSLKAKFQIFQTSGELIHQYDKDLLPMIGLAQDVPDFDTPEDTDPLEFNRDNDTVTDLYDQCDNSRLMLATSPWGCAPRKLLTLGYKKPEVVAPYIVVEKPQEELTLLEPEPELEPEPMPEMIVVDETKAEQTFTLSSINFDPNSADLTSDSFAVVKNAADQLKGISGYTVQVIGHTDSQGSKAYNKRLSERRAATVRKTLIEYGVEASIITAIGKGPEEPIAPNNTAEGRATNRRIEFKLIKLNPIPEPTAGQNATP